RRRRRRARKNRRRRPGEPPFSRSCDACVELAVQTPSADRGGGKNLPRHVGGHGRRHGAALVGVRAYCGRRQQRPFACHWPRPYAGTAVRVSAQVDQAAAGVRAAMRDAGIDDASGVHFVQVKCPLLVAQRVAEADRRGPPGGAGTTLKSMGLPRAASALGVAVALGEIDRGVLADTDIGANWSLWSSRASASAGIELINHEIVVMGMSKLWSGPLAID